MDLPNRPILIKHGIEEVTERMWSALWNNYIRNLGTISLPYWADQYGSVKLLNIAIIALKPYVKTTVVPERSWAEAGLDTEALPYEPEELTQLRAEHKFSQYRPSNKHSVEADLVRVNGRIKRTGLKRHGFAAAANTQYEYDVNFLAAHYKGIVSNTTKGMRKVREQIPKLAMDEASYDSVSEAIILDLIDNPKKYSVGKSYLDSRGRAIKENLSEVANPIQFKDFRSLLVIPK